MAHHLLSGQILSEKHASASPSAFYQFIASHMPTSLMTISWPLHTSSLTSTVSGLGVESNLQRWKVISIYKNSLCAVNENTRTSFIFSPVPNPPSTLSKPWALSFQKQKVLNEELNQECDTRKGGERNQVEEKQALEPWVVYFSYKIELPQAGSYCKQASIMNESPVIKYLHN